MSRFRWSGSLGGSDLSIAESFKDDRFHHFPGMSAQSHDGDRLRICGKRKCINLSKGDHHDVIWSDYLVGMGVVAAAAFVVPAVGRWDGIAAGYVVSAGALRMAEYAILAKALRMVSGWLNGYVGEGV